MGTVGEVLSKRSPVVNIFRPDQQVGVAVRFMAERQVGAVLVVEAGRLVGIFSERDLLRRVLVKNLSCEETPLESVMTRDPITATPEEARLAAIAKMREVGCRHLPILSGGAVVDMVSIRDLLFIELDRRAAEIEDLKRYIQG